MKLALHVSHLGADLRDARQAVRDLESAGLDRFNVSESYTFDSISQVGYLAAITERAEIATTIVNVYSRTASTVAMTAAGCDDLSHGRFVLGLGTSGPAVIEGFHGVRFERGVSRVRDYIAVTRLALQRQPVVYSGATVAVPLPSPPADEERRPLKLIRHPLRPAVPIWWASITPAAVRATAEVADGWLPAWFTPEQVETAYREPLAQGRERRAPGLGPLEISAQVAVGIGEDPVAVADTLRPGLALYVGGMGSRRKNFYNELAHRLGQGEAADRLQDLYLGGRREEAAAAVPAGWIAQMTLAGAPGRVRERLAAYREAGVTVLDVRPHGDPVRCIAALRNAVDSV